ncbi:MAG: hypothetical protein JNL25_11710 [Rhodospirillaceae bacterium]|nr:hypothetical protein [Rhodospirillaceae bacterium]
MRKFALVALVAILAGIVLLAGLTYWGMQKDVDVSTPEAQARFKENFAPGCRSKLPELIARLPAAEQVVLDTTQMNTVCACVADEIIGNFGTTGSFKPADMISDARNAAIEAAELACLRKVTAP